MGAVAMIFITGMTAAQGLKTDSISMGAGYANEVYYSLANGNVQSVPRNTWDIAFRTGIMSSGILTNDGSGVVLYTYPKSDTSGWANVDTTGLSSWPQMFNDPDDWENGAFSRNATGHPDYGWGIYNQTTHNLTGDSIFIIQLRDGSFRKLLILGKKSAQNIYEFRYANLDGSGEQTVSLNLMGHLTKEFYGYDLQNNAEKDFQPARDAWDILFTRYKGLNSGQPYTVVGVLSNNYLHVKRFEGVPQSFNDWWVEEWDSTRSVIGYDWKAFTGTGYDVNDSLVYFITDRNNDIYKLYFTEFEGSASGKVVFNVGKVSSIGVGDVQNMSSVITVTPNPASDVITVKYEGYSAGDKIRIVNMAGLTVLGREAAGEATSMDVSSLSQGIYFVQVTSSSKTFSKKIIISR